MKYGYLINATWDLREPMNPRAICTSVKSFVSTMTDLANEKQDKGYMTYNIFKREANASDTVKKSNAEWLWYGDKEHEQVCTINGEGKIEESSMRKFLRKNKFI